MTRREERVEAFKIVFQNLFSTKDNIFEQDLNLSNFTKNLVETVENNKDELIHEISSHSTKNKRLFLVDLAIIMLAYAEVKYEITPKEVAVNEAVEIAKIYSTDESPAFVNAFLKAMIK